MSVHYEGQRIEGWQVIGGERLSGDVYNRPGHRGGARIVTSPVVEIRLMGSGVWPDVYPIAFTESGNAYRLGRPAAAFCGDRARSFIRAKLSAGGPVPVRKGRDEFDPDATVIHAAVDTSLQLFERIELYEASFKPL